MKIINQSDVSINDIVTHLKKGKTFVYPTETCYGLGCDAANFEAVEQVFTIKQRQKNKPVLILVRDVHMASEYINWSPKLEELALKYWPGQLTVVVPAIEGVNLPSGVLAEDGTIALRVTDHLFVNEILEKLGGPIVSTSANIAEQASPYDIEDVLKMFQNADNRPDLVVDAGTLPHRAPSTIVRVEAEDITVLRQGEVVVKE